jgi:transposase
MTDRKQFVTRESLREELANKQILEVGRTTLSIILKDIGFVFKNDNGRRSLMEKPQIASRRIAFLRAYQKNAMSRNPLDVVFLDETWIYQNGSGKRKVWHDNDPRSVWNKRGTEGKRYIILHAGNSEGFIDGAGLIFSTKDKSADYHNTMNAEMFEKWIKEQLLPRLERPSLIIMDNASYHSRRVEKCPNAQWTKDNIIQWLRQKHIAVPEAAFKCELLELVQKYRPQGIPYAVDELVSKMGHTVLRLPPYHCQFNAIELIWAQSKQMYDKHIGRDGYSENAVLNTWEEALHCVTSQNWADCIRHTEKVIQDHWAREIVRENDISPLMIHLDDGSSSEEYPFTSDSDGE